ncbi:putative SMP-30/Gluconolaconase/LRE domain protein [Blattamonas nauphoetae]|uniref:SMP-30/Gluconolaconase/LRE domain protein n=1 Tax=Blattamonas nauphoetae TaxID=2049346 RepID=A0ABQ9X6N3_9EUKA|nr:putative SMP-30/Gluconolaconase/LRE domain protein [Blattamonas nauphoetae]
MDIVFQGGNQIASPALSENHLVIASTGSGEVFRINLEEKVAMSTPLRGSPSGVAYDSQGSMVVADLSSKAIMTQEDKEMSILVCDFEGSSFKGPNTICFDLEGTMYFTDSGPFGETNLFNATGSLFSIDKDGQHLQPMILNALAYPSGITYSSHDGCLYICETMTNRLLRGTQFPQGVWHFSVFHQFSGSMGPMAVAIHPSNGNIYVGMFDFMRPHDRMAEEAEEEGGSEGVIGIISPQGDLTDLLSVPGTQITGLCFGDDAKLYITESSSNTVYSCQC